MERDWQSLLAEASRLRREGKIEKAITVYRRLLKTKPSLPDSWYNLALLEKQNREYDESLRSYQRALDLGAREPQEIHVNRAVLLTDHLHRHKEAKAELDRALELAPDYIPALINLGNWFEDVGRKADAKAAYLQALAVEPDSPLALTRLAGVSHSNILDQMLVDRLGQALDQAGVPLSEQAGLAFALGGLLDAAGRYDEAFSAFTAANLALRAAANPFQRYDRSRQNAFVERQIRAFDRRPAMSNDADCAPIFICGLFRSGSTLVERILASDERVIPCGELDLLPEIVRSIPDYPESIRHTPTSHIRSWRNTYLSRLPCRPDAVRRLTDKRPENFLHLGLIKTIFPGARIVVTKRHPADNLLSLYFLHLDLAYAYASDLDDLVHWYQSYERLMAHWLELYEDTILTIDYDRLVADPETEGRNLFDFCGLEWSSEALNFYGRDSPVRTASNWQVRSPIYRSSSGRWRNYFAYLGPLAPYTE